MAVQPDALAGPELLFREDLEGAPLNAGVDRGWWQVRSVAFPYAAIEIAAAPRASSPDWFAFRFDISIYPQAPSAQPWDLALGLPLPPPRWPGGSHRIQRVFNPAWRTDALYLPMDALALEGHDGWLTQHACHVWDPGKDITQYLRLVHDLLNEEGYTGVRG
ncbi:MAG: DUF7665 family protein [Solirubrobacteraceae bacterium]